MDTRKVKFKINCRMKGQPSTYIHRYYNKVILREKLHCMVNRQILFHFLHDHSYERWLLITDLI